MDLLIRLLFRLFRNSPPAFKRLVAIVVVTGGVTLIVVALVGHSLTLAVQGAILLVLAVVVRRHLRRHPHLRYRGPTGWLR